MTANPRLEGTRTADLLRKMIANESESFQRYSLYAEMAKSAGQEQTADVLAATARNEGEHARRGLEMLLGRADANTFLDRAEAREKRERTEDYAGCQDIAREEGFADIAEYFEEVMSAGERQEHTVRLLRDALSHGQTLEGRTVGYSSVDMAQTLMPDQANVAGYVHGGELMKVMDNAAWVVACRHSRKNGVTANVEEMNFHSRVRVGDLVLMHARITFAGRTSMEVLIDVETEDLLTGKRTKALAAYFTVVAIDPHGNPTSVPPLIISTDEEARLFAEGKARYEARRALRKGRKEA